MHIIITIKRMQETPKIFYYDTHKIINKIIIFFSCIYKNGPTKYYVLQKPG